MEARTKRERSGKASELRDLRIHNSGEVYLGAILGICTIYIYIYGYDGMPESHALLQTKIMVKMVKKNGLPTTATAGDPEIPDLH